MSHQPERKEKDCLNCGTNVLGRFCHYCGQENIVTKQSFWSLTVHFVSDILHFDGKFFHTLAAIFTRPGYVALQYVIGKRMTYLDPIRMYLFTSAMFFLVFFSTNDFTVKGDFASGQLSHKDRRELADEYRQKLEKSPGDTALLRKIAMLKDTARNITPDSLGKAKTTFSFDNKSYGSLKEYDSVQAVLPQKEKDGWIEHRFMRQLIQINEKYGYNEKAINLFADLFLHKLPYLLFLSLPFFAFILKLLYKRRSTFYYSDHAVFTLYHYIFSFILLLVIFGVNGLKNWTGWGLFGFLQMMLILSWPVYLYIELKNFYRQGKLKTFGKFVLLNIAGFFVVMILFVFFFLFSIFQL